MPVYTTAVSTARPMPSSAVPPRISVYHDMPFAILRYDPAEEWDLRREVKLLATRLEATDKEVHSIPMSEFLWTAIDKTEGLDEVVGLDVSGRAVRAVRNHLRAEQVNPLTIPRGRNAVGAAAVAGKEFAVG